MARTLKVYWWDPRRSPRQLVGEAVNHGSAWMHLAMRTRRLQNFGDAVNPLILGEATGRRVEWSRLGREDLVGIGSILNLYSTSGGSGLIFGSGVRDPDRLGGGIPAARFLGVRGLLSAASLSLGEGAAIGDPGLLISNVVTPQRRTKSRLFVPHFTMLSSRRGRAMLARFRASGYDVVLPSESPEIVARAISRASYVVTTSLHAVVFADSYGVRCALLADAALREPEYKYLDYRSVFGVGLSRVTFQDALAWEPPTGSVEREFDAVGRRLSEVKDRLSSAASALR